MSITRTLMVLTLSLIILCGCRAYVSVDKRPNLALPIIVNSITNDYVIVDQGYVVNYSKWGFNTEIQSMTAELTTNKTVKFTLGGFNSTMVTNSLNIKMDDMFKLMKLFREVSNVTNDIIVIDREMLKKLED